MFPSLISSKWMRRLCCTFTALYCVCVRILRNGWGSGCLKGKFNESNGNCRPRLSLNRKLTLEQTEMSCIRKLSIKWCLFVWRQQKKNRYDDRRRYEKFCFYSTNLKPYTKQREYELVAWVLTFRWIVEYESNDDRSLSNHHYYIVHYWML